jgi:hypothetical protein
MKRRRVVDDPELLELFADEPELIAVVDAIAQTQRGPRKWPSRVGALGAALAIVVALALVAPSWRGNDASLVAQALAAVDEAPVLHVVAERHDTSTELIDLDAGSARPVLIQVETWYDEDSGRLRTVTRRQGQVVSDLDEVGGPAQTVGAAPAAAFTRGYRKSLERSARGEGVDEKRRVLELSIPGAGEYDVSLNDAALPSRFVDRASGSAWRIATVQTIGYRTAYFEPDRGARASAGAVASSERATAKTAATRLRDMWWLGPRYDSMRLGKVTVEHLSRTGTAHTTIGVRLLYGSSLLTDGVEIREARSAEPAYGFNGGLTLSFDPVPLPGTAIVARPPGAQGIWVAQLRVGGMYVTLRAARREAVVRAARSLRMFPS